MTELGRRRFAFDLLAFVAFAAALVLAFVFALAFVPTFGLTFWPVVPELRMWMAANCAKVYATIRAKEPVSVSNFSLVEVPADLTSP
jgi:hypothetical protein